MIIYDVLQHYYDIWCSPESWSSMLTSLLAENNRGASKNTINARFKRCETCRMFSGVLSWSDTTTRS